MGIAPPRVADQMLAGDGQTGERVDIARVVSQRGEEPALCLGRQLGRDPALDRDHRPGKTLVEAEVTAECCCSMAARLLQGEEMKLSGDLPGDFGLCRL